VDGRKITDAAPPFGTVVFDCDSTLSAIEGVDELAELCGVDGGEIAALTERAMAGELPLEEVYGARLEMLTPDAAAIERLAERYWERRVPRAEELIDALLRLEKRVCVVSGGVLGAVAPFAARLGIERANVFAVEVFHDRSGAYAGFDELSPLARAGGKLDVMRELSSADRGGGVAFVGDGATDLEAAPAVRRFVAFGGVARRPAVYEAALVHCDEPDLSALLPLLASEDEIERLGT
jgi:phosphoserine phosphatase